MEKGKTYFNPARYDNKISERYYNLKSYDNKTVVKHIKTKNIFASCWDGDKIYRNITKNKLMEITGASDCNVSIGFKKNFHKFKGWVYSKELDVSKMNFKEMGFSACADDGNRLYFGNLPYVINKSTKLNLSSKKIHLFYHHNMIEIDGVKIYINHK